MNIELLSATLEMTGTLLIAWAALRVHHRVLNEHKVDDRVFRIMRKEQKLGILGMVFVASGYLTSILL